MPHPLTCLFVRPTECWPTEKSYHPPIPTPTPAVGTGRQKDELSSLPVLCLCLSRLPCWANIQLLSPKKLKVRAGGDGGDRSGNNFVTSGMWSGFTALKKGSQLFPDLCKGSRNDSTQCCLEKLPSYRQTHRPQLPFTRGR